MTELQGPVIRAYALAREREAEFLSKGGKQRDFFPHRLHFLPKCGPDGFKLASRTVGRRAVDAMWEVVLYAEPSVLEGLPEWLFFDQDLIWHQQHFGRVGQIATANLVQSGNRLYTSAHLSDLVQRIGRRRDYRSQVESRFHGWDQLLLNGILLFAHGRGIRTVYTPTASLARRHTDPARDPGAELFDRVYDRHLARRFVIRDSGDWWAIDVAKNLDRVTFGEPTSEPRPRRKVICICHDVERGLGHRDVDPGFARDADAAAPQYLEEMLRIERQAGIRATYNVVGSFLTEIRADIEQDKHALAFHSFDHQSAGGWRMLLQRLPGTPPSLTGNQVARCRTIDYRVPGYRPPRSRLTPDVSEANLCLHNFEWLASSAHSLRLREPRMQRRIVRIPILFDDFQLYRDGIPYAAWEERALAAIDTAPFVAFSLHDCYGSWWLPHYPRFLESVAQRGSLETLQDVANETILASGIVFGESGQPSREAMVE